MFDIEQFVANFRDAIEADASPKLVREVLARAISDPAKVLKAVGEPVQSQVQTLYRSPTLTVLNVCWAPLMAVLPHNHRMWAVIGIYAAREDNILWRRLPDGSG